MGEEYAICTIGLGNGRPWLYVLVLLNKDHLLLLPGHILTCSCVKCVVAALSIVVNSA